MAISDDDAEVARIRSSAFQTSQAVFTARERAAGELRSAREALEESTRRLELALSAGRLGDWTWDASNDLVTLSDRASDIFNLPRAQPVSWANMRDLLHEDDRERARKAVEDSLASRGHYSIEYRLLLPSGVRWIAANGFGIYGEDGAVRGMVGVVRDVTQRRQAEQELREQTRTLEVLNDTWTAIAAELDLQSVVQLITDRATELSGAQFGAFFYNVIDRTGESFLLYTLSGGPREAFERFGLPRNTPVFETTFRGLGVVRSDDITKDPRYGTMAPHHGMPKGHLPVCSYLAVPVKSRTGEVIGGLFFGHPEPAVFTEASERLVRGIAVQAGIAIDNARLYEAAQKAAEERSALLESERLARGAAERMSDMKDQFLATLSHELRTPLNAIVGWAHVLRRGPKDQADLVKGLDTIERNARAQAQLIEDLLDVSRITSGKVRLDVQPLQPSVFIDAAIDALMPAAEAKGLKVARVLDPAAGPISGDPGRLQQVVWNLVSNAIKFTPRGGKVQVLLERIGSHIEINVADTGIGIKSEFLPHLFERFRQGDASTTRKFGGLGLGLSIVKSLVELHGGTVRANSPGEERGTTITVLLPLTVVHRSDDAGPRVHPLSAASDAATFPRLDLSGIKVLVVDDQPDARDLIQRVLEDCEARVFSTASAEEALPLLDAEKPNILISDIGMPGVDGFEFLRRVRATGSRVPAVALTAFASSTDRTRALRAGFLVHVAKPVDPAELVATVASVVGRARLDDA